MKITRRQSRQAIKETSKTRKAMDREELDTWISKNSGKDIKEFPRYSKDDWGKDYVEELLKMKKNADGEYVNESMKITRRQLRPMIQEAMITEQRDPRTDEIVQAREKMKTAGREFWDVLTALQPELGYQAKMVEVETMAVLGIPSRSEG
jgi:hypothetical protein